MEDQNQTTTDKPNNIQEEAGMLKAYKELQENSVSKEKYDHDIAELKEKNELYLKAITQGNDIDLGKETKEPLEDQIKSLSKFKGSNLEYWAKMTDATDGVLSSMSESEICKTIGTDGLEELVKVNEGMKEMVKDSNGDPDYFRTLYKNRVVESAPRIATEIEKAGGVVNYMQNKQK